MYNEAHQDLCSIIIVLLGRLDKTEAIYVTNIGFSMSA